MDTNATAAANVTKIMICGGNFTAKEMLEAMTASSFSKALLIFSTLLTYITVVIFFEIVVYVSIKVPYGARRGYTIYLLGLFPISKTSAFLCLTVISLSSTLVGVYGLTVFYKVSRDPLKKYWIREKFIALKIVMIVPNVQTLLLATLIRAWVIRCIQPFSASLVSNIIYNFLVIYEMFLLIAGSRYVLYRLRQRNCRRRESSLLGMQNVIAMQQEQQKAGYTSVPHTEINDILESDEKCSDIKAPEGSRIVRFIETDV